MSETPETPVWEYVALGDRARPEEPAADRLRAGLRSIWERLRPGSRRETARWEGKLDAPPRSLIERVVPPPDVATAAEALARAVDARLERGDRAVLVLFEAGGTTREALARLTEERGWSRIEPPPRRTILDGTPNWPAACGDGEGNAIVVPALERCYLRHHRGLDAVRRLFEGISRSETRFIVGCDAWAWSYLRQTLYAGALFPSPLALQGFDASRLERWLSELSQGSDWVFRDAASGACVLRENGGEEETPEAGRVFLEVLAGRSRGLPEVARAVWRYSLSVEVSDEARRKAEEDERSELRETLWVTPWSKLTLPRVPAGAGQADLFALHTLLLHGGLEEELLDALATPSSNEPAAVALRRLERDRLVTHREGTWRVDLLAYPAVARHIADHFGLGDGL